MARLAANADNSKKRRALNAASGMTPTVADGQPAAAAYQRGDDGVDRAFGLPATRSR